VDRGCSTGDLGQCLCDLPDTELPWQWSQRMRRKGIQTSLLCLEQCATTPGFHLVPAGLTHVLAYSGAILARCDSTQAHGTVDVI
jgi:hypothetical protein